MLSTMARMTSSRGPHASLQSRRAPRRWVGPALALVLATLGTLSARAQEPPTEAAPADVPPEQVIDRQTKDGVEIRATYYPGTKGRDSAPLILLHMFAGDRGDFHRLAKGLQLDYGFALLAPDLRGHGESVRSKRQTLELSPDRLRPADFEAMVEMDLEIWRGFLREEHNAERLNLERLGLVGAEMGAVVAMRWAAFDWSIPPLGKFKQGQFVRALALLSPQMAFRGLNAQQALRTPALQKDLALLVVAGVDDREAFRQAEKVYDLIAPHRRREADEDDNSKRTLFFEEADTSLQGTGLLDDELNLGTKLAYFLELKLAQPTIAWQTLKRPTD